MPAGIKVKMARAAQVAVTKAGAVLRTEVNLALIIDAGGTVVLLPITTHELLWGWP